MRQMIRENWDWRERLGMWQYLRGLHCAHKSRFSKEKYASGMKNLQYYINLIRKELH